MIDQELFVNYKVQKEGLDVALCSGMVSVAKRSIKLTTGQSYNPQRGAFTDSE